MSDAPEKIRTNAAGNAIVTPHPVWDTDVEYIRADLAQAMVAKAREDALREAAEICTNVIKSYDVMEPGKPGQYASLKTQKAAKGMVSLARQDIEALIEAPQP